MIELKDLRKSYKTGSFEQRALDGVSITFRDNEFVSILGPSGSGKTTLLNELGGLDHADSGDIVINGVSTKDYKSSDWDTYRNHRIGFIFQSYNLIPHQTILSNVELALTLSGVGREERRERATKALEEVGLGEHIDKKPAQLSGGQMQRVAIARALVNNPDIVLADEPTGALDTETGVQVMDLLSTIAKDRLVIMVTHNPELAEHYSTRIVKLADGRITDDSDPFDPATAPAAGESEEVTAAKSGKSSMNFLTALSLSFNNLMTKKGRTFMTAFAGSIGIIGIAAILALSNGVNAYIDKTEEDTLSSYPISITKSSFDMTSMMTGEGRTIGDQAASYNPDGTLNPSANIPEKTLVKDMFDQIGNNDLKSFKSYIDSGASGIEPYVNEIDYDYGISPSVYKNDTSNGTVRLNPSSLNDTMGMSPYSSMGSMMTMNSFNKMVDSQDLLDTQYDVVTGSWPKNYDECVVVLNRSGGLSDYSLYNMGVLDTKQLADLAEKAMQLEKVDTPDTTVNFTYEQAMQLTFKVINPSSLYEYNESAGAWTDKTEDEGLLKQAVEGGTTIKVVGIVKPNETTNTAALSEGIAYSPQLVNHLIDQAAQTPIVQAQLADTNKDVFTGKTFDELKNDKNNSAFDMENLFTVDSDAIANAFKFDTSALGSGMDMGSMDTSGMMGSVNMDALMAGMPEPDFSGISIAPTDASQALMKQLSDTLIAGFYSYYYTVHPGGTITPTTNLGPDITAYLNSPGAQNTINQTVAAVSTGATADVSQQVQATMQDYFTNSFTPYMRTVMTKLTQQMATAMGTAVQNQMSALSGNMQNAMSVDENVFANAFHFNMSEDDLTALVKTYMTSGTISYDANLTKLGYADLSNPNYISIYPKDFEAKDKVSSLITAYNDQKTAAGESDKVISYSDVMGVLISSVTDIVNMISYVLIAFVSISLVVSSIMIGIITYISVLERKKEIGILRAMGASKGNIANVFNAETVIEGFIAGVLAIAVVLLVSIPVNILVLQLFQVANIMQLPWNAAITLIVISVLLTLVAGLIPSSKASRRDPVEALRSE